MVVWRRSVPIYVCWEFPSAHGPIGLASRLDHKSPEVQAGPSGAALSSQYLEYLESYFDHRNRAPSCTSVRNGRMLAGTPCGSANLANRDVRTGTVRFV